MTEDKTALKITDPTIALEKIKRWCAYQERSQQDVRDKLFDYGLWPEAVESIISELIQENFLNEERFAIAFARGKFRIKKWGRLKIRSELKKKRVTDYCIKKALQQIDDTDYIHTLRQVLAGKQKTLKESHPLKRLYKLAGYAVSRGFESDIVMDVIKQQHSQ